MEWGVEGLCGVELGSNRQHPGPQLQAMHECTSHNGLAIAVCLPQPAEMCACDTPSMPTCRAFSCCMVRLCCCRPT